MMPVIWSQGVELGDVIKVETQPADFGRIAAQTAKQVILQRIREAEARHGLREFCPSRRRVDQLAGAQRGHLPPTP